MNNRSKPFLRGAVFLLVGAVIVAVVVLRPRISIQRETSLVGPDDRAIQIVSHGTLAEIQQEVKRSGKKPDEMYFLAGSLLYWAVKHERIDVAKWLLAEGSDPNGHRGAPPLEPAIRNRDLAMVRLLLKHGANPDLVSGILLRDVAQVNDREEILAALTEASPAREAAEMEQDLRSLGGTWSVEKVETDGRVVASSELPLCEELEFSGHRVIGFETGDASRTSFFRLIPGSPIRVRRYLARGQADQDAIVAVGIVRIVENQMQWCEMPVGDDLDKFPETFSTSPKDGKILITLRKK